MLLSEPFIPQTKILKVIQLAHELKGKPKTVKELAVILDTSYRTIYRYLHILNAVGAELKETYKPKGHRGPDTVSYFLEDCPFCGKNVDKKVNTDLEK